MIEEAVFNAHVLYSSNDQPPLKYTDFKIAYIKAILDGAPKFSMIAEKPPPLSQNQHFFQYVPMTNPKYPSATKRCVNCHKNGRRKHSRYQCDTCIGNPGLCINCYVVSFLPFLPLFYFSHLLDFRHFKFKKHGK